MTRASKRVLGLGLAGILLVAAVGAYVYFTFRQPIGTGPAGPAVARDGFGRVWSRRPVFLVGLGDSVTAGYGARRGYGYFDRLVSCPADEFGDMKGICLSAVFPGLHATNLSVSGSISHDVAGSQLPLLPKADAETLGWVVITTGGNDLIHNYGRTPPREQAMYGATWGEAQPWIASFAQRLETMVTTIGSRFPGGCHIFLANIYDPTDGAGDIERAGLPAWRDGLRIIAAYNDVIRHCADQHPNVHLVDFHDTFLGHGIHCAQPWATHYASRDPHYWYYSNLEDPNERGYDAIRRLFLIEMAKAAKQLAL